MKATSPDHGDYTDLTEAAKEFEALVAQLNERKRTAETHQKIMELMNNVEGLDKVRPAIRSQCYRILGRSHSAVPLFSKHTSRSRTARS